MFKYAIPVLHVSDSAEAERFYCEQLGFVKQSANRADPAQADPCSMAVARDGVWIHLSSFSGDGVSGGVVYLGVENVDSLHRELSSKGVRIDTAPVNQDWGNREMYVKDADGNCIRFIQPLNG